MDAVDNRTVQRLAVSVRGVVQGVGFRPFVFRACRALGLTGTVRNTAAGVDIEVQGAPDALESFMDELRERPPALALIVSLESNPVPALDSEPGFRILDSSADSSPRGATPVSPDIATCGDCLSELFDPADRRHAYPFLNCTCCGPRFTITERTPYDRPNTAMKRFPMCAACAAEYADPADRRFHAQPTACPECGPRLALRDAHGNALAHEGRAVSMAADLLRGGGALAIKGLGGFHLACGARCASAVQRLRAAKIRDGKPFAVMVRNAEQARAFCAVSAAEERLLQDPAGPIALLEKRCDAPGALHEAVAPNRGAHGVLLPYTPLHHLLLAAVDEPLVMTSGNRGGAPMAFREEDAFSQLRGAADAFLTHDRDIVMRCDDSVMRVWRGRGRALRRARGLAPAPLPLPLKTRVPILACGADLKNTFALARGRSCIISHHGGDLDNPETLAAFERSVAHYEDLFDFSPEAVACDMHPDYATAGFARALAARRGLPVVAIQHHHAHVAACLADAGECGPVIGVALDGSGYGPDGAVWGGEFLIADLARFKRAARLAYAPMPGGDAAARQPWRMAASHLFRALGPEFRALRIPFNDFLDGARRRMVSRMIERGINAPMTSSMGRLFDAAAALCGFHDEISYEGQAAAEFEALCGNAAAAEPYEFDFHPAPDPGAPFTIDPAPVVRGMARSLESGESAADVSARFHAAVARMIALACDKIRSASGLDTVALTGGVFQNWTLLDLAATQLEARGFRVLAHERVPCNDGGICLGQAAIAAAALRRGKE